MHGHPDHMVSAEEGLHDRSAGPSELRMGAAVRITLGGSLFKYLVTIYVCIAIKNLNDKKLFGRQIRDIQFAGDTSQLTIPVDLTGQVNEFV